MVLRLLLLGLVFLGWAGESAPAAAVTASEPVSVKPGSVAIGRHLDLFEDPTARLTIDDIRTPAGLAQFRPSSSDRPYIGFTRSAWWGTFAIINPTDAEVRPIIKFGHPIIDRLEFYRPAAGGGDAYRVQITGDSVGLRDQDLPSRYALYRLSIPPGEMRRYFFRISGDSPMAVDVSLLGPQADIENIADRLRPLVLGALAAAIAFSLAIYVVLRDRVYLIFALFILSVILYQAEIEGYLAAYIWPQTSWLSNLMALGALCLMTFAVGRFTNAFLALKQKAPLTYRILQMVQIGSLIAFLVSFIDYHVASYLILADLICAVVASLMVSGRLWRSGGRHTRLYALCWLFFCFYAVTAILQKIGIEQTGVVDVVTEAIIAVSSVFIVMVFTDRFKHITQANEQQLQKARDAAIAASRAKSKFLATMSHELRTPLNAVIGFSEVLTSEALGPLGNRKYREYANDIKESGLHLLHIINDVLEISRVEAEQIELDEQPIILSDLIRRCLRLVEERARESNISLRKRLHGPLPSLRGDETRIQQVLINLLHNAIKFTPPNGSVVLEAGLAANGEFRFAVIDTGIGIDEEDKERILDPFIQIAPHLTRHHGGVGLGLAIAKSIIDLHQGRLEIHSAPGKGSTFAVFFPSFRVVPD